METRRRTPLQDLPLEQFLTHGIGKMPRSHKRPLSPSRTTLFSPAKRHVLDAAGIPPSDIHTATPTRPSKHGDGFARNYGSPQGTLSLSSRRCSPSRELYPEPTIESSTDPQSRHYPGFDIFRDSGHRQGSPVPRLPPAGGGQVERPDEDKENVPLKRRAKKLCSKKRPLSGLNGSDASCFSARTQTSKVVHPPRTPFSARQALR